MSEPSQSVRITSAPFKAHNVALYFGCYVPKADMRMDSNIKVFMNFDTSIIYKKRS